MDLLTIWQALWRNRWLALPMVLLTMVGAVWVVVLRPPVYESSASLLLLQPPPAPSEAQIRRDPRLAKVNADNPYTRTFDPAVIIGVVADIVQAERARTALAAQGADRNYLVTNRIRYGFSSPLVEITGIAGTPDRATATTRLVSAAFIRELRDLQASERVDPRYFVTVRRVDGGDSATMRAADKIRALVGVLGLGVIGLFGLISIADAVAKVRAGRRGRDDGPAGRPGRIGRVGRRRPADGVADGVALPDLVVARAAAAAATHRRREPADGAAGPPEGGPAGTQNGR